MLVAGVAIAVLVVLVVRFQVNNMIDAQNTRNRYLENEIVILDNKIKEIQKLDATRRALIERMGVIQSLQATRPGIVHLFDEVVDTLPDSVYLTGLTQVNNRVSISGQAESNARVSSYMRNIEKSEWLSKPTLGVISSKQTDDNIRISEFSLSLAQRNPDADLSK